MDSTLTVLSWLVFITLAMAIAKQLSEQVRLADIPYAKTSWNSSLLEKFTNPAPIAQPSALLDDFLVSRNAKPSELTAKTCYETDFSAQSMKTGNYIQRTNNFKHSGPDNCSAPLTEFVNSVYTQP